MSSKAVENYRDHPSLQNDSRQIVFKINGQVYLLINDTVRQIIPKDIYHTNIGEPYRKLVRLDFMFANDPNDVCGGCIDFHPDREDDLRRHIWRIE